MKSKILLFIMGLGQLSLLYFVVNIGDAKVIFPSDPFADISGHQSISDSIIETDESIIYTIFLTVVLNNYTPCLVAPSLISPPDGTVFPTLDPVLSFDGGDRTQPNADWIELDMRKNPDFTGEGFTHYLSPVKKWENLHPNDNFTPGTYYWRAALFCGPGWPIPPGPGYERGPYSEVRSFTLVQP